MTFQDFIKEKSKDGVIKIPKNELVLVDEFVTYKRTGFLGLQKVYYSAIIDEPLTIDGGIYILPKDTIFKKHVLFSTNTKLTMVNTTITKGIEGRYSDL